MPIAITRPISDSFASCQLTHLARQPIDLALARREHEAYERALEATGCEIHRLPAAHDLPDAIFVEDTAVVLEEVALVTRPGAESRRAEVEAMAAALPSWRAVVAMEEPGTLDGGDVLRVGRRIFVGDSGRTNQAGFEQLRAVAEPLGYRVRRVPIAGCLHLKSAVTAVAAGTLLLNPAWLPSLDCFAGFDVIAVDPGEPHAANALLLGETVIYASGFPRTLDRLQRGGITPRLVEVSEIAKAEGAVTCCSVIVQR